MNDRTEVQRVREQLASRIPLVQKAGAQNLARLIARQRQLLDRNDPALRELVQLLSSPAVQNVGGKPQKVHYSDPDEDFRDSVQRTLMSMGADGQKVRSALSRAAHDIAMSQKRDGAT